MNKLTILLLVLVASCTKDIDPMKICIIEQNPVDTTDTSLNLLTRTIHSEAIEYNYNDNLAVATVIMNRLELPKNKTIEDVVSKGFSGYKNKKWHEDPSDNAKAAARAVMQGYRSFDSNVRYYLNIKHSTDTKWVNFITAQDLVLTTGSGKWTHSYYQLK